MRRCGWGRSRLLRYAAKHHPVTFAGRFEKLSGFESKFFRKPDGNPVAVPIGLGADNLTHCPALCRFAPQALDLCGERFDEFGGLFGG